MSSPDTSRLRGARSYAHGYSRSIRRLELFGIFAFFLLLGGLAYQLWPNVVHRPGWFALAFCIGYWAADFISGFVHWMADSWGSVDMPLLGKTVLRPFREHHVDPEAITRHDFVETNGNNCLVSLGPLLAVALLSKESCFNFFLSALVSSCALWILGTNQFHKWAHLKTPPRWIGFLQRIRLILPPEHHAIHHKAPFNKYYCITAGWLNRPLHAIQFFAILELWVTSATGALPRREDIGEAAALEVAPRIEPAEEPAALHPPAA